MKNLLEEKLRRAREMRVCNRNRSSPVAADPEPLVVEIDGDWHQGEDREDYDRIRDRILTAEGYHTLCISVTEILEDIHSALDRIQATAAERINAAPEESCRVL